MADKIIDDNDWETVSDNSEWETIPVNQSKTFGQKVVSGLGNVLSGFNPINTFRAGKAVGVAGAEAIMGKPENLKQIGSEFIKPFTSPMESFSEQPVETLFAWAPIVGGVFGKLAKVGSSPFSKSVRPGMQEASQRLDISLPASAKTTSGISQTIEAAAAKSLFGGGIAKKIQDAENKLVSVADNVIKNTGEAPIEYDIGKSLVKSFREYNKNVRTLSDSVYEEAAKNAGIYDPLKKLPASTKNTESLLKDIVRDSDEGLVAYEDIGTYKNMLSRLDSMRKRNPGIATEYDMLKKARTKIGNMIDWKVKGQGELKQLYKTLSTDMKDTITNTRPELAQFIEEADIRYKMGMKVMEEKWAKAIDLNKDKPDLVLRKIINPNTSLSDIPKIFETIGEKNVPKIQSYVLSDILDGAKSSRNGLFTESGLTKQLNKWGKNLKPILTEEQLQAVKDIETISKGISAGQRVAEGSQTAFIARLMVPVSMLFTNPLSAVGVFVGDAALSKFVSSSVGQKWLTTGIPMMKKMGSNLVEFTPYAAGAETYSRFGRLGFNPEKKK